MSRVFFIPIRTNQEKVKKILEVSQKCILELRPLLIKVNDEKAGLFLDELLWKHDKESFLPHVFTLSPTKERICITTSEHNLNEANAVLNLTGRPILKPDSQMTHIYEFEDHTAPEKSELSRKIYSDYRQANFPIAM